MSKELQDELTVGGALAYLYPSTILGAEQQELIKAIGRLFGDLGARAPLFLGDWRTSSATFTQATTVTNGVTLDQREALITLQRDLDGDLLRLNVRAFAQQLELRVWLYDSVTWTSLGSATLTTSGASSQWLEQRITITSAQGDDGGDPRPLLVWMEGRTLDTEGRLWQVELEELRLESTDGGELP